MFIPSTSPEYPAKPEANFTLMQKNCGADSKSFSKTSAEKESDKRLVEMEEKLK